MSVGYPLDKDRIDVRAGALSVQIRDMFKAIQEFQGLLSAKTDADLVALGYSQGDVTLLKSAFTQLDALRQVANGSQAVPNANNFLFFSAQLVGVN